MAKPKVLLLGPVFQAHSAWDTFAQQAEILVPKSTVRDEFIKECKAGSFDGVVAVYRGPKTVAGKFDAEMVEAFPKSLRFVCYAGG
jgi:glyoxylate reductase